MHEMCGGSRCKTRIRSIRRKWLFLPGIHLITRHNNYNYLTTRQPKYLQQALKRRDTQNTARRNKWWIYFKKMSVKEKLSLSSATARMNRPKPHHVCIFIRVIHAIFFMLLFFARPPFFLSLCRQFIVHLQRHWIIQERAP